MPHHHDLFAHVETPRSGMNGNTELTSSSQSKEHIKQQDVRAPCAGPLPQTGQMPPTARTTTPRPSSKQLTVRGTSAYPSLTHKAQHISGRARTRQARAAPDTSPSAENAAPKSAEVE